MKTAAEYVEAYGDMVGAVTCHECREIEHIDTTQVCAVCAEKFCDSIAHAVQAEADPKKPACGQWCRECECWTCATCSDEGRACAVCAEEREERGR